VLAGLDPDDDVRIVGYPGSSLMELLRPKPSSQPAAASLPEAVGVVLSESVAGLWDRTQHAFNGTTALLLGDHRF
jgi:protease-4